MERDPAKLPKEGAPRQRPWNGFWWPDSKMGLGFRWAANQPSPIEKYDEITGKSRRAVDWELKHNNSDSSWEGQCDGFSLASVLEPQPKSAVTCRGVKFEVGDIKGLLGSVYLGDVSGQPVTWEGRNAHSAAGSRDLDPATLHLALTNAMGREQQGIYLDVAEESGEIFNKPLASYEMSWEKGKVGGKEVLNVRTVLKIAEYEQLPERTATGLHVESKELRYVLELDSRGYIVPGGGAWFADSAKLKPVALKFPYGRAVRTRFNNPHVDKDLVFEIAAISAGTGAPRLCAQPKPRPAAGLRQPEAPARR